MHTHAPSSTCTLMHNHAHYVPSCAFMHPHAPLCALMHPRAPSCTNTIIQPMSHHFAPPCYTTLPLHPAPAALPCPCTLPLHHAPSPCPCCTTLLPAPPKYHHPGLHHPPPASIPCVTLLHCFPPASNPCIQPQKLLQLLPLGVSERAACLACAQQGAAAPPSTWTSPPPS